MSIKVALVTYGGWPDTFQERVQEFSENCNHVYIFRAPSSTVPEFELSGNVEEYVCGRRRSVVLFPVYYLYTIFHLTYLIQVQNTKLDVVHSLDCFVGPLCALSSSILNDTIMIVSFRGFTEHFLKSYIQSFSGIQYFFHLVFYYIIYTYYYLVSISSDHIIVKSSHQRTHLISKYGAEINNKLSVIPTGVNFDTFNEKHANSLNLSDSLISCLLGTSPNDKIILYLGRLLEQKGVINIARYHATLSQSEFHLAIVGPPTESHVVEEVKSLSVDANISLYPNYVPHRKIPKILLLCDTVVLLTNLPTEGCPKILQESLAMETTVVASDVAGISEDLSPIRGVELINPHSKADYVQALEKVTSSGSSVDLEAVKSKFNIKKNYSKIAIIYEKCSRKSG